MSSTALMYIRLNSLCYDRNFISKALSVSHDDRLFHYRFPIPFSVTMSILLFTLFPTLTALCLSVLFICTSCNSLYETRVSRRMRDTSWWITGNHCHEVDVFITAECTISVDCFVFSITASYFGSVRPKISISMCFEMIPGFWKSIFEN